METQDKLVITLNPEMLDVVKQALADYAGDKNSKDYLEVIIQILGYGKMKIIYIFIVK